MLNDAPSPIEPMSVTMLLAAMTAACGAAAWWLLPLPQSGYAIILAFASLRIALADITHRIVPDLDVAVILVAGIAAALAAAALPHGNWSGELADHTLLDRIISGVTLCGGLLLVALLFRAATGRDGLGMGDVKLVGSWCVWLPLLSIVHAITAASIVALLVILASRHRRPSLLAGDFPLAALLSPALWLTWLFAEYYGLR